MSSPFNNNSANKKLKIIRLKGKNKVKPYEWKGMNITLTYIGDINKNFGINKKQLTMKEAMSIKNLSSFKKFQNPRLKALSNVNFTNNNFEEINIDNNNNKFNHLFGSPKIMKCEKDFLFNLKDFCIEKLKRKKMNLRLSSSRNILKHLSQKSMLNKVANTTIESN